MTDPETWPEETTVVAPPDVAPPGPPPPGFEPPPGVGPGGPPEGPDDRFGLGMLIGLVALAAVGGIVAAFLLTRDHKHSAAGTTTVVVTRGANSNLPAVPDVVGRRASDAISLLRSEDFTTRFITVTGPPPAGRVVGESPAAGRQAPNGFVTLSVSDGTASKQSATTAPVTTAPAQTTTAQQPTTTAQTTTSPTTTSATTTQAEQPATAPAPTPAPTSAPVPDVTGQTVQAGAQQLSAQGFLVTLAYVPQTDPLGTIVAESPSAGKTARTGGHVTLNASVGPGTKQQETVPDVTGKSIPDAVSALQHAGLRLIFLKKAVTEHALAGKVVEQTPVAGRSAPKNAQILVYMGAYRPAK